MKEQKKPWQGRFDEATDKLVEEFTSSHATDRHLARHDILGSKAHAKTLAKAGIISEAELAAILKGLDEVAKEIAAGAFKWSDALEDVHMHIESRLFEITGEPAHKLHTARSRNDQVALDLRLYLRERIVLVQRLICNMQDALCTLATKNFSAILPGYTHLQRAQPVLLAHHLLAYFEMLSRDSERFGQMLGRVNILPLGAAALAGTTFPIDRQYTANLLGFDGVAANSMDAVSDRDSALEFCSAAAICMTHLSRLCEEIVLWSSAEFGFVTLSDSVSTGSSIMPQKKNPDVAELVRGKTGRVYGSLMALLTLMKSLPLAYNRDMQEDKPPLFDAADTLCACLAVTARMIDNTKVNSDKMRQAASKGFLNATDLADYLAAKGLPFRKAHHAAGKAVAFALAQGKELEDLSLDELCKFDKKIQKDIYEFLALESVVGRRKSLGGTAPQLVKKALAQAKKQIAKERRKLEKLSFEAKGK
jgi:argininosuccinate lyase